MTIRSFKDSDSFWDRVTVVHFFPTDLPNLKLWLDAADTSSIEASGGAVSNWNDKSGNDNDFKQATAANKPTTGTNTKNSKNVITFDGGDWLTNDDANSTWQFMNNSTGCTVFVVLEVTGTNNPFVLDNWPQSGSYGFYLARDHSNNTLNHNVIAASGTYPVSWQKTNVFSINNWYYITVKSDPANATAANRSFFTFNNGTTHTGNTNSATPVDSAPDSPLSLSGGSSGNKLTGKYAEVIIYSGILSNPDIDKVENYLAEKWAI